MLQNIKFLSLNAACWLNVNSLSCHNSKNLQTVFLKNNGDHNCQARSSKEDFHLSYLNLVLFLTKSKKIGTLVHVAWTAFIDAFSHISFGILQNTVIWVVNKVSKFNFG